MSFVQPASIVPYPQGRVRADVGPVEIARAGWLSLLALDWHQGEHMAIMGRTGRGKTTLARDVLALRGWAVALAVKRDDDTLLDFPQFGYQKITKWPPNWDNQRVLYWARPESLAPAALTKQRNQVADLLNDVFINGGWAVLFDDVAYIANTLGFRRELGIMLNQARSSHSSLITCMTQPSSVTQSIPSETWRQVRFHLVFKYRVGRDLDAIADITGYDRKTLQGWMAKLGPFDFLAFDDLADSVTLVRHE